MKNYLIKLFISDYYIEISKYIKKYIANIKEKHRINKIVHETFKLTN